MITLEQIKEMYPNGCEVSCLANPNNKAIVKHSELFGEEVYYLHCFKKHLIALYSKDYGFAKITKPSPTNNKQQFI